MPTQSLDQKFAAITRDIDWQRASFLSHNLEIAWSPDQDQPTYVPAENIVRKILDHYFLLALLFYRQLRSDLLEQYKAGKISDDREVKIQMQSGLDKLVMEWYRVYAAVLSIRASHTPGKARAIMQYMQPVLDAAKNDTYLSSDFLSILHFGQDYSMRFFNYLKDIAAINVPLATFESPWEWTILWHELAGEKVRSLLDEDPAFFTDMFEEIIKEIPEADPAEIDSMGWSAGWLQELFEDSFSVVNFPIHFLFVLKNLLERYPEVSGDGTRHPPDAIRLACAMSYHLQNKGFPMDPAPPLHKLTPEVWCSTWNELNTPAEKQPERFAMFDPAVLLASQSIDSKKQAIHMKMTRLAAAKLLQWHNGQTRVHSSASPIKDIISAAMIQYSNGNERTEILSQVMGGIQPTEELFGGRLGHHASADLTRIEQVVMSKRIAENNAILDSLEMQHSKIRRLLRDGSDSTATKLGYEDLLSIPFDDVDFGVETVTDVVYNNVPRFGTAKLRAAYRGISTGTLKFTHINPRTSSQETIITTIMIWNNAAAPEYRLIP